MHRYHLAVEIILLDDVDQLLYADYGKHLENFMQKLPKRRRTGHSNSVPDCAAEYAYLFNEASGSLDAGRGKHLQDLCQEYKVNLPSACRGFKS